MSKRLSTLVETWRDAAVELPDDDLIVLVHTPHTGDAVWPAYHDGERGWVYADGMTVETPVKHWMPLPEPPK